MSSLNKLRVFLVLFLLYLLVGTIAILAWIYIGIFGGK